MKRAWTNIATLAWASILELYRRKDVYTAVVLALIIVTPLASVNFFGVGGVVRYLREVTLLLIWLFSIAIALSTAARQIPLELEQRTIYPLLAHPVRRSEFVIGKFAGAFAASTLTLLLFYLCFIVLSGIKSGQWFSAVLFQAIVFHVIFLALAAALTIFWSTFLTPSATLTCSALIVLGMFLFGLHLPEAASKALFPANWILTAAHIVLPHFEFFDLRLRIIHGWEPVPLWAFAGAVLYGVGYSAVLLAAAVTIFQRKQL